MAPGSGGSSQLGSRPPGGNRGHRGRGGDGSWSGIVGEERSGQCDRRDGIPKDRLQCWAKCPMTEKRRGTSD